MNSRAFHSFAGLLSLALGASLFGLLALEVLLRGAGYTASGPLSSDRHRFLRTSSHPDLDYELVPGARGVSWQRPVEINRHGFRGREVAEQKPVGTQRVVVLGDSIAFAGILDVEERFTELLEARLRQAGQRVEVLNLGVGGYDVLNEVALLEAKGLAFAPDRVVLTFAINDLGVHSANLRSLRWVARLGGLIRSSRLAEFVVVRVDRLLVSRDLRVQNEDGSFRKRYRGSIREIEAGSATAQAMGQLARLLETEAWESPYLSWYTSPAKVGRLRHSFERLQALSQQHGFDVILALVPYLEEADRGASFELAYSIVSLEAARTGFDVQDLRTTFHRHPPETLRRHGPLHPNARGHQVIADALYPALSAGRGIAEARARPSRRKLPKAAHGMGLLSAGQAERP